MFAQRRHDRRAGILVSALAAALVFVAPAAQAGEDAPATSAPPSQSDDGFFKSALKNAHMTTDDLGHPQDFVVKSRPDAPTDYVPVFRKPEEHKTKALTPDQVKAMEAELDAAGARNARIRDAFPPARRAYRQEEREKAARATAKRAKKPAAESVQ